MEEHPVPQNVTDFEFHLVGDMTLKQFGYLAFGLVLAYVTFIGFNKIAPLVAYPLIVIFASTGAAFAFLPIQQRPLDHWVSAFLKAIFQPTQRTYQSQMIRKEDPFFKKRLTIFLTSLYNPGFEMPTFSPKPIIPSKGPVGKMLTPTPLTQPAAALPTTPLTPPAPVAPPPTQTPLHPLPPEQKTDSSLPSSEDLKQTITLAKDAQLIQSDILDAQKKLEEIRSQAATPGNDSKDFTQKFQGVLSDLQKLNQEAEVVSKKLATVSKTPLNLPSTQPVKARSLPTLSLTAVPNILNGIITDALGNYVEGAIVVAHDKQGIPVRALKSNKLGQFIAATPLPTGQYSLSTEKENLLFDVTALELKGEVIDPLVIQAKKAQISIEGRG